MPTRREFFRTVGVSVSALVVAPTLADAEAYARRIGALPPVRLYPSATPPDHTAWLQSLVDREPDADGWVRVPRGVYVLHGTLRLRADRSYDFGGGSRLAGVPSPREYAMVEVPIEGLPLSALPPYVPVTLFGVGWRKGDTP